MVRAVADPLLSAIFVLSGIDVLQHPEGRAKAAAPVVEYVASVIPVAPTDPVQAVRLNAMVQVGAGSLLMLGIMPRLMAAALSGSLVLTTFGGHRFWELEDKQARAMQRTQFLKNSAMLGGLLLRALD